MTTGREPRLPYQDRLDELLRIYDQAQQQLINQVETALASGNLASARGRRAQLAAVLRYLDELGRRTDPTARRIVADAYQQSADRTATQIAGLNIDTPEIPGTFASLNAPAIRALENSMLGRLQDARQTVGRRVDDVFGRAQRQEALRALTGATGSPGAAARSLERNLRQQGLTAFTDSAGREWDLRTYSQMAMRTITREAVVQGSIDRMLSHGVDVARVSTHATACKICQPWEGRLISLTGARAEFQGEAVSNSADAIPPFHPNAVIAGTTVLPVGRATGGVRATWNGPLCRLTTRSGVQLAIGPNHPVLTARGWLAAKLVQCGDRVIHGLDRQRMGAPVRPTVGLGSGAMCSHNDLDHGPAAVEEVFEAMRAVGVHSRVMAAPGYLHGDGNFCEGEIDVVRADRLLAPVVDASIVEPAGKLVLVGAEAEAESFPSHRSPVFGLDRIGHAAPGAMGRSDASGVTATGTDRDAARLHPLLECASVGAQFLGELRQRLTCDVAVDEVVEVRDVEWWSGHAFDLETPSGTYFANGILVHNCAHTLMPVSSKVLDFMGQSA